MVFYLINHHHPQDVRMIHFCDCPGLVATISGGEYAHCASLLQDLQLRCHSYQSSHPGSIPLQVAISSMMDTLSSRVEVGLIARWDIITDAPVLYHVDGFRGLIKAEISATGHGFRMLYSFLDLNLHFNIKKDLDYSDVDDALDNPSQYQCNKSWSFWSVHEALEMARKKMCEVAYRDLHGGDFISVFSVKHHGMVPVSRGEPIRDILQGFGCFIPERPMINMASIETSTTEDDEAMMSEIDRFLALHGM